MMSHLYVRFGSHSNEMAVAVVDKLLCSGIATKHTTIPIAVAFFFVIELARGL